MPRCAMLSIRLPPLGPPLPPLPALPAPGGTVEEFRLILASLAGAAPLAMPRDPAAGAPPEPKVAPEDSPVEAPVIDPGPPVQPLPEVAGPMILPADPVPAVEPEAPVAPGPAQAEGAPWPVDSVPEPVASALPAAVAAMPLPEPVSATPQPALVAAMPQPVLVAAPLGPGPATPPPDAPPRVDVGPLTPQPRVAAAGVAAALPLLWAGSGPPQTDPAPSPPAAPITTPRPEPPAATAGLPAPVSRAEATPPPAPRQEAMPAKPDGAVTSALVTALRVKIDQSQQSGSLPQPAVIAAPSAPAASPLPDRPESPAPLTPLTEPAAPRQVVGPATPTAGTTPPEAPPPVTLPDSPPDAPRPDPTLEANPTDSPRHDPQRPDPPRFDPARIDPPRPEPPRPAAPVLRQVVEAFTQVEPGGFDLALDPQELGHVRMTLIGSETGSLLVIQAERPETLDLLRRHVGSLEQDLRNLGHSVTLHFGSDGQRNPRHPQSAPVGMPDPPGTPAASVTAPERRVARGDHLDLRL